MTCYSGAQCGAGTDMDQSPLGSVLGHLAQMSERQGQLQQTQSKVLTEHLIKENWEEGSSDGKNEIQELNYAQELG
ncbi:unnamed protein product [Boreogadus saida]